MHGQTVGLRADDGDGEEPGRGWAAGAGNDTHASGPSCRGDFDLGHLREFHAEPSIAETGGGAEGFDGDRLAGAQILAQKAIDGAVELRVKGEEAKRLGG